MKRVFHMTILFVAVVVIFVSCSDKPKDTITNLKLAITGETNANATYLAYSEKAAKDGYRNIANLFRATAAAENIHLNRHNDVLQKLGEEKIRPKAETSPVNSTEENIQAAFDDETTEYTKVYPSFIATAKKEKCSDAVASFTWAKLAEENHAALYAEVMEIMKLRENDTTVPTILFVCAQCGGIFSNNFTKCEICRADTEQQHFIPIVFNAGN